MLPLYENKVSCIYGRGSKGEKFGVEIEMEPKVAGTPIIDDNVMWKFWQYKGDGSLRKGGMEAVSVVLDPGAFDTAFNELKKTLIVDNLDPSSPRTSVHVHVNYGDNTLAQVVNAVCLFVLFEDLFLELSGKTRKGNNFALSTQNAEGFVDEIIYYIANNDYIKIDAGNRYSALNLHSLHTFGTVEFRTMRGLVNADEIRAWLDLIMDFYRVTVRYPNPREMLLAPLEDLIPKNMTNFFDMNKIREVYNSNLSNALSISYAQKTNWSFKTPEDDLRIDKDFVRWCKNAVGFSDQQILCLINRELNKYYKKYQNSMYQSQPDKEAIVTELAIPLVRVREGDFWFINDQIEVV